MDVKFKVTFEKKKDRELRGNMGIEGFREDGEDFLKWEEKSYKILSMLAL